jgi:transketolase
LSASETTRPLAVTSERVDRITKGALGIRRSVLRMGEVQGQGYVGQGLGVADILAVLYLDQARTRADDPDFPERDRVLLSIGHYAIALYAALAEAGFIDKDELDTYGADDSRLPMSAMASYTPGVEISGGSLGHGLGVAVGMALGLRHQGRDNRVFNLLSDGELDEGATWEAAAAATHHRLGRITAVVDVNALQADGPTEGVVRKEPVVDKWRAFGWSAVRVDGNDPVALLAAFDEVGATDDDTPAVLVCDTKIGRGVPLLEAREKAHFMRIEDHEWEICRQQLEREAAR